MFFLFDSPGTTPDDCDATLETGGTFRGCMVYYLMGLGQVYEASGQRFRVQAIEELQERINPWLGKDDAAFFQHLAELTAPKANLRPPIKELNSIRGYKAKIAVYSTVRDDIPQLWYLFHPEIEVRP